MLRLLVCISALSRRNEKNSRDAEEACVALGIKLGTTSVGGPPLVSRLPAKPVLLQMRETKKEEIPSDASDEEEGDKSVDTQRAEMLFTVQENKNPDDENLNKEEEVEETNDIVLFEEEESPEDQR